MTAQTVNVDELEKFSTSNRREILFYLHQLINDGERISVIFEGGKETVLTLLLDIDEARNELIFDWGGSEESNQRLLRSDRNLFVCAPHGVRNQFLAGAVRATTHKQQRAFVTQLPASYTRLQRREYFRLLLPLTRRPLCTLMLPSDRPLQVPVVDLSIGGVALELQASALPAFEIGRLLPRVRIDLKKGGAHLDVDLEVRNVGIVERGEKTFRRIGCRFVELPHGAEHLLQRFITDIQREERARLGL